MTSDRPMRPPEHRSGGPARDRAVMRVRRATTLIGLAATVGAAGLGVLVASETTANSSASAADRVTSAAKSTAPSQGNAITTSPTSAASASSGASAGTTSTGDPTTTTTTTTPETHTVSGQS
jgi:hypothetical protein